MMTTNEGRTLEILLRVDKTHWPSERWPSSLGLAEILTMMCPYCKKKKRAHNA